MKKHDTVLWLIFILFMAGFDMIRGGAEKIMSGSYRNAVMPGVIALAAAVCHQSQNRVQLGGRKFSGWENFLAQNKDRIITK